VKRKIIWMLVSCLMVLSLVIASCGPKVEEEAKVTQQGTGQTVTTGGEEGTINETAKTGAKTEEVTSSDKPQYGGSITLAMNRDVNDFLPWSLAPSTPVQQCNDWIWNGDWAKGPAGGYGTNDVGWEASTNIPSLKAGYIGEDIHWAVDDGGQTATIYITVKKGIHYSLDPTSEASRLVNGRELTVDDVIWNYDMRMNDERTHPGACIYPFFPWIRGITCTKIGPQELSMTFPIGRFLNAIMDVLDGTQILPPEVDEVYHAESTTDWRCSVGVGPFMMEDYVPGNVATVKRNPNYYGTNPIGPGKGDQLPYLDKIKYILMQDLSTQLAAFRTGQLDQMNPFSIEDRAQMIKENPDLKEAAGGLLAANLLFMRTDRAGTPYADVRVRQAMMMATDFNEINDGLYQGLGQIQSWPYWKQKGYEDFYLDLDAPDCPDEVKELYVYNPEKAKQLLTEAGYPNGFKAEVVMQTTDVDYYSIIKDMWSKVGIDLTFKPLEYGQWQNVISTVAYDEMITGIMPPPSTFPEAAAYTQITWSNASLINDPYINKVAGEAALTSITDMNAGMRETRELMKYLLPKAYVIPTPRYPTYTLWWPWLKNYSGETCVGWLAWNWPWWVWVDKDLMKSMGY
jgi:peptide/nickel transport system substrate-binding protein